MYWLIVVAAVVSARLAPSRFAGQSIEWSTSNNGMHKEMAPTNEAVRQPKQPPAPQLRPAIERATLQRRMLCQAGAAMEQEWAKSRLLQEQRSYRVRCANFLLCVFACSYLAKHQPPGDRTTTDMLHFDQYFRLVCSDLMYGGDKVMNYVIFCSRVKIGGAGTFAFPPSRNMLFNNWDREIGKCDMILHVRSTTLVRTS